MCLNVKQKIEGGVSCVDKIGTHNFRNSKVSLKSFFKSFAKESGSFEDLFRN